MTEPCLQYDVRDAIATLTLNRPEAYNALDLALGRALFDAVIRADEDRGVRCVVITGAGRAFCGGGDVKSFHEAGDGIGVLVKQLTTVLHGAVSRLARMPKPVITAINGVAAGGGLSLALAGDLAVAAESARFTLAYSRIGASPDVSATWSLPRLVGARRAIELHFTNRALSAREALDWGMINRVLPDGEFAAGVAELARELADGPTVAFGHTKRLVLQSTQEGLETQMELEAQAVAACSATQDFREGVAAFANRRPVKFAGR